MVSEGQQNQNGYLLGVDVGGTFTDVCVITPEGKTVRAKTASTPHDQSIGVKIGIDKVRKLLQSSYNWNGKFDAIHHGTTVATNAILEEKGVVAGLVVTPGFKDVLVNRRSQIPGGLGAWINFVLPPPMIPLERTVECPGRMAADGTVVSPVDEAAFRKNLEGLQRAKPDAIVISFMNGYRNDLHEKQAAAIVRDVFGPGIEIICSAEVLPELGEYERTVTAAANAVVKPLIQKYLQGLERLLANDSKTIRILKSDGGLTSLHLASELPVNLLMSGPAGGVQGVVDVVANNTTYKNLITLDMGGTSTDCALIIDGKATLRRETMVDKLTVRAPSVDVKTIGAGGGSIAKFVDLTATMRVGPQSAGAVPGPAAYGKGGTEPTVTDANLVLGYLPERLLGGDFQLDVEAATASVKSIADQMGMTVEQSAEAIINLVNETIFGALRNVSVEQGYDPRDFALVAFGGAGPLHANAVGKLLGAWPVIVPPAPGVLCAEGDVMTKLRHEQSSSYVRLLSDVTLSDLESFIGPLKDGCVSKLLAALGSNEGSRPIRIAYEADLRFKGQALTITIPFTESDLSLGMEQLSKLLTENFNAAHEQQFGFTMPFELELVRLGVIGTDASASLQLAQLQKSPGNTKTPPDSAVIDHRTIVVDGQKYEAVFWDRSQITFDGCRLEGPCVISEMDSNTLVLPGFYAEIDHIGNILINPANGGQSSSAIVKHTPESASVFVAENPVVPTLISSALAAIRNEMDSLVLRASMSPGIREQQDEFNVVTDPAGKMLVGQFGSFIGEFLSMWTEKKGTIEEGDIFITNDPYQVDGAISHLCDVIILLPIFYDHKLVGWSANFGHLSDVGGKVPGSMSITSSTIFEDGVQIPCVKLYEKGRFNADLMEVLCRNSRMPDWYRSDVAALISSCKTAAARVCDLIGRFGPEVYAASCSELLRRNRDAISKIISTQFHDKPSVFTDFCDDDGTGVGPYAVKCKMTSENGRLIFDWDGTSPQSDQSSLNFFLSPTMFKMFVAYYLIAVFDPYTIVNDGFNDLIDVRIPEGSILRPIRPAGLSCRTHMLGRVHDIIQALMGQKNESYRAAAGFSDSPHFFYSGWKPNGEWFQLYQITFGGVPARQIGDGIDCHCLWPAIKSVPAESIELGYPLRIEASESLADTGGAGFYRGGNAQRTRYRFLSRGEISIHDDRWFTHPWGIDGGQPGKRSRKTLLKYSVDAENPPTVPIPSKCDHIKVAPGDVLEYLTWGGGGMGDPLERPAEKVALEVRRKLVTLEGAKQNYGVIVEPDSLSVDEAETVALRAQLKMARKEELSIYSRGRSLAELRERSLEETGLPAPRPQWEEDPYGPHMSLPYIQNWYKQMRAKGDWELE